MNRSIALAAALIFPLSVYASRVGIIDSGTDYRHVDLVKYYLKNSDEVANNGADDDQNGYIDDVYGWNFAESNNKVIDYQYLGTFGPDTYKFFDVQSKMLEGTARADEKQWMSEKRDILIRAQNGEELSEEEQKFVDDLETFGNFAHGTHCSGIATKDSVQNNVFAAKIIPTKVQTPGTAKAFAAIQAAKISTEFKMYSRPDDPPTSSGNMLLDLAIQYLVNQEGTLLTSAGQYVNMWRADAANGSFGIGYAQAQAIIIQLYGIAGQTPTDDQLKMGADYFMALMMEQSKNFVRAAPNTLFVFAAGNDASDNDAMPSAPCNAGLGNSISVAATLHRDALASFSNYGATTVDVAAPGVAIYSTVPGDEYIKMSGTSMAAPYVTNIAGEMRTANPNMSAFNMKKILMGTVDYKDFLKGKVVSGGVVNKTRAIAAAKNLLTMNVDQAIQTARTQVPDVQSFKLTNFEANSKDAYVLPLLNMFN